MTKIKAQKPHLVDEGQVLALDILHAICLHRHARQVTGASGACCARAAGSGTNWPSELVAHAGFTVSRFQSSEAAPRQGMIRAGCSQLSPPACQYAPPRPGCRHKAHASCARSLPGMTSVSEREWHPKQELQLRGWRHPTRASKVVDKSGLRRPWLFDACACARQCCASTLKSPALK